MLATLVLGIVGVPSPPGARPTKTVKIAILTAAWAPWHRNTEGFRDGLRDVGYVEGKSVTFDVRAAAGDPARLPQLAAELVRRSPDLLFCVAGPEALACQKATDTIPIVFTQTSDPVKVGLVRGLAKPGGNITGISSLRAELTAKRLELFKELVPSLRRVLITYDPRESEERDAVASARLGVAQLGGLELIDSLDSPIRRVGRCEAEIV
jgi:putative ABC transport system substrate-binding protein